MKDLSNKFEGSNFLKHKKQKPKQIQTDNVLDDSEYGVYTDPVGLEAKVDGILGTKYIKRKPRSYVRTASTARGDRPKATNHNNYLQY